MDTSKIVGEKIKALREDKSISIEELAQRSGLAIEQVERIENNIDIPSLAPLIKIARVLGVRLGTFLDDQDEVGPVVCRKKEAKDAISFSNNAIHSRKHMEYHSLSKSKADRHMEPFIIDVMPTEDTDFVLSSHEGKNLSWLWKVSWKSATARIPICWKRVIAFIMIPLFLIMYMLTRAGCKNPGSSLHANLMK